MVLKKVHEKVFKELEVLKPEIIPKKGFHWKRKSSPSLTVFTPYFLPAVWTDPMNRLYQMKSSEMCS